MIVLRKLSQLETATMRAHELRPACRPIEFGVYEVQGSRGNWYTVRCWRNEHGQRLVACSCADKGRRRSNVACYHMSPAIGAHILLAMARDAVAKIGLPVQVIKYNG